MANDGQPPLRYPPEVQMSSFEGNHGRQGCVPKYVGMLRCHSGRLSSHRLVESDSHKTEGFSARESRFAKRLSISDEPDAFVPMLDTRQGIRSSLLFRALGDFQCIACPSRSFCSPHLSLFRASVKARLGRSLF